MTDNKTDNKYGKFSKDGLEYIINTADTPRPWVNYLTNGRYASLCSQTGGGFSFYTDHRFNQVLRRDMRQHLTDAPARLIYIKDEETGEVWTANVHPFGKCSSFTARHGMGYTTLQSSYRSIQADVTFFVPPGHDAELWNITLTNRSLRARKLSIYTACDFQLGNVSQGESEPTFMPLFNVVDPLDGQTMLFRQNWWHTLYGWHEVNGEWPLRAFVTATTAPLAMCADRNEWLGGFGDYHNPAGLKSETIPQGKTSGKDITAVMQWRIELEPKAVWTVHQAVGVQPREGGESADAELAKLKDPATYTAAFDETRAFWKDLFASVQVNTPDTDVNTMMNGWNKYQLMVNFFFGRGPSYYHKSQYPAMRDCCQDAFGVIPLSPQRARENLLRIGHFFFADGRACGGCNRLGLTEGPSIKVDLPLWYVLAVCDYLRESDDWALLDEQIPLMDGGSSSVYDKMIAGLERMCVVRGSHGLPLMGKGDWNDAADMIGAGGKGESVWLGQFLYFVIQEVRPVMDRRADGRLAGYLQRAEEIKQIVNDACWDGEWFVRAFKDDGTPVGSHTAKEGFIWINSNTWAVIADIASPERLNRCMDSVEKHMGTPYGLMNLAPAYTQPDPTIGLISRFRSGWKENAAVFSHASSFNVVARARLGRGKDATDLWRRILPVNKDSDTYLVEPYIYSQFCAGPASSEFGRGAYHWLTGTAAWMFRSMLDYILGVRAEYTGLRVDPVVDPTWKKFTIRRRFRGSWYNIDITNPAGVERGVTKVIMDGQVLDGTLLPPPYLPEHHIKVTMG